MTIVPDDSFKLQQIPETVFKPIDAKTIRATEEAQLKSFDELLNSISSLEDKKRALYKTIYAQALTDRNNAYMVFTDLYKNVHGEAAGHAIHGQTIAKYLERMSKCTDQLLKLVEILASAEEKQRKSEEDGPEDIYNSIGSGKFK